MCAVIRPAYGYVRGLADAQQLGRSTLGPMASDPVACLICGRPCVEDSIEGLRHEVEPVDYHPPKVRNPFTGHQDANQAAARIVREATGD